MNEGAGSQGKRAMTALLVGAHVLTVVALLRVVQRRVWNDLGAIDVVIMVGLVLPFMILPSRFPPRRRLTRYAWWISAIMALDVLFFALSVFGPLGTGHPSLEALGSSFLGLAKLILVPVALLLLAIAGFSGERMILLPTGVLCLAAETLYAVYPATG